MLTLGHLINRVARNVQVEPTDRYASVQIVNFLNQVYQQVWDAELWPYTKEEYTATVTANTDKFVLPKRYADIIRAWDASSGVPVRVLDIESVIEMDVDNSGNASAVRYEMAPTGQTGVLNQLSSASIIKVSSSATADTSVEIYVRGIDASGNAIDETITLNASDGTTVVSGSISFTTVVAVAKGTVPTSGTITLTDNAGTTTVATISPTEKSPIYRQYRLSYTPVTALSVDLLCKQRFTPFLNNLDVPFMEMDNALIAGATALCWDEMRNPELARQWEARYQNYLSELRQRELNQSGQVELMVPHMRG